MPIQVYVCAGCGRSGPEPTEICGHCGGEAREKSISGLGRIYSYSKVHLGPAGMETPYVLALVELEGAGRVLGRLEAPGTVENLVNGAVRFAGRSEAVPLFRLVIGAETDHG